MQSTCQSEIALKALLLQSDALIEAGIFDRDGNLRGQCGHGAQMVFGEESPLGVLQIEHADNVPLIDERHNQFGARFGIELDVSRILGDVRYEQRLFMLGGDNPQVLRRRGSAA